ncbi:hypothetical protein NH340_JMT01009 [Sarcoptes scabiei]|nr:hypothetical protein NH340_JMT01009 [Sarcoptes scabiei]
MKMNFKKSKDIKRASYYVWFLGAKESKGLRGDHYVQPVLNYLLENECDLEPSKVTLQISSKGLKIIQILTVPKKSSKLNADQQLQLFNRAIGNKLDCPTQSVMKTEQVKHHIPHDSISWIYQDADIICAILLLYNPITRCPVHIHAYRCDSIQTANNLRQQLQILIDRPENQKKFREIESRLAAKALNSDGRSTRTDGSDEINSEESNSSDQGYAIRSSNRGDNLEGFELKNHDQFLLKYPLNSKYSSRYIDEIENQRAIPSNLFDSLAAELRAKLGNPKMGPLLLPPRDYDSQKRKSQSNKNLNKLHRSESSGKSSSGRGSEEAISMVADNGGRPKSYYFDQPTTPPVSLAPILDQSRSSKTSNQDKFSSSYSERVSDDRENDQEEDEDEDEEENDNTGEDNNDEDGLDFHGSIDCLEVDVEDFEEDVIFTTKAPKTNRFKKSTNETKTFVDIEHSKKKETNRDNPSNNFSHRPNNLNNNNVKFPSTSTTTTTTFYSDRHCNGKNKLLPSSLLDGNFDPSVKRSQQQQHQSHLKESSINNVNRNRGTVLNNIENKLKNNRCSSSNNQPPLSSLSSTSSSSVIGRREQRFAKLPSQSSREKQSKPQSGPVKKFYFADAEFTSSSSPYNRQHQSRIDRYHRSDSKDFNRGRSMGRLDLQQFSILLPRNRFGSKRAISIIESIRFEATINDVDDDVDRSQRS